MADHQEGEEGGTLNQEPPWTGSLKWLILMTHTTIQMIDITWERGEGGRGEISQNTLYIHVDSYF